MKVYIAGKITGLPEYRFKPKFANAEQAFLILKYQVVNPVKLDHNHDKKWKSYMRVCLRALKTCDFIFMLNDWQESEGAKMEHWFALRYNIKVIYQPKKIKE